MKERGEYDSEGKAVMTLGELEMWLALQVTGAYHDAFHRGLGVRPIDAWQRRLDSTRVRHPADPERFYIDFLPFERRLIRRDGIQLFRIHYWDSALSVLAGRSDQKLLIRYDPRDLSKVYVKDAGSDGYLAVPYRDLSHPPIILMEQRDTERILRVRAEHWIHYSLAKSALVRTKELLAYPQRDRMPCLLLYGATGMGKTKILRKFLRDHPTTFDNRLGITSARAVAMQMPPDPDEKSFYEGLLSTLQAPSRYTANTPHLRRIARDLVQFVGARILIIDEVHALLAGSYRQQRILLNILRLLATDLRIPLVCAGTADAKRALTTDQQLRRPKGSQ